MRACGSSEQPVAPFRADLGVPTGGCQPYNGTARQSVSGRVEKETSHTETRRRRGTDVLHRAHVLSSHLESVAPCLCVSESLGAWPLHERRLTAWMSVLNANLMHVRPAPQNDTAFAIALLDGRSRFFKLFHCQFRRLEANSRNQLGSTGELKRSLGLLSVRDML